VSTRHAWAWDTIISQGGSAVGYYSILRCIAKSWIWVKYRKKSHYHVVEMLFFHWTIWIWGIILRIITYLTYICWEIDNFVIKSVFLGDFSFYKNILKKLSCYHDNYFRYFMFGKCNSFVSKARVSACMYFLEINYKLLFPINCFYFTKQNKFKLLCNFSSVFKLICISVTFYLFSLIKQGNLANFNTASLKKESSAYEFIRNKLKQQNS
jgi:hypothetical protein